MGKLSKKKIWNMKIIEFIYLLNNSMFKIILFKFVSGINTLSLMMVFQHFLKYRTTDIHWNHNAFIQNPINIQFQEWFLVLTNKLLVILKFLLFILKTSLHFLMEINNQSNLFMRMITHNISLCMETIKLKEQNLLLDYQVAV